MVELRYAILRALEPERVDTNEIIENYPLRDLTATPCSQDAKLNCQSDVSMTH